jgi:hypothetical protein
LKLSETALNKIRVSAKLGKDKDIQEAIDEALDEIANKKSLAEEVKEFVMSTDGYFFSTEVVKSLHLSTEPEQHRKDMKNISIILRRLREGGVIEKYGSKQGVYRRIERDCEVINWQDAPTEEIPLRFPLEIEEYVKIYPKSLIVVAGKSDAGKTGFLLEFARLNMDKHEIHLFINEAGDSELAVRLGLFKNIEKDAWKCTFWEREDGFADVIKKDAINIIDYLDVTEGFAEIGTPLKDIHNKLDRGIALVAIQKNPKRYDFKAGKYIDVDLGIGGAKSIGKSRLYLSIDDGIIKIVKAKNRRGRESPNGMTRTFKIYDGHDFSDVGCWTRPQW